MAAAGKRRSTLDDAALAALRRGVDPVEIASDGLCVAADLFLSFQEVPLAKRRADFLADCATSFDLRAAEHARRGR